MKKLWMPVVAALFAVALANAGGTAWAIKPFETEWKKTYYKPDGTAEEKKLAAAVDAITTGEGDNKSSCNICHMGSSKKMRNAYGVALDALLDKAKDKADTKKMDEAFKTVEGEKSPGGKTFGELIKAGELPGK
ncbi:MAG: hypothetical protein QM811_17650 [Pirellulales bacterium]